MKPDLGSLRDIHMPRPVSWWPPAPGWWLSVLLALLLIVVVYLVYRRHRQNRWRRSALAMLAQLQGMGPEALPGQLSILLRRVAVSRFPRGDVAGLTGQDWLAFLDRTLDGGDAFRAGAGRILLHAPYRRAATVDDHAVLIALCERWIRRLPARGGS